MQDIGSHLFLHLTGMRYTWKWGLKGQDKGRATSIWKTQTAEKFHSTETVSGISLWIPHKVSLVSQSLQGISEYIWSLHCPQLENKEKAEKGRNYTYRTNFRTRVNHPRAVPKGCAIVLLWALTPPTSPCLLTTAESG